MIKIPNSYFVAHKGKNVSAKYVLVEISDICILRAKSDNYNLIIALCIIK